MWHKTTMRVPMYDVDLGMAVYHGSYYHLYQIGRDEFLRDIGIPYTRIMALGHHLTIVEANCKYRKPLHYDEAIEVQSRVTWIKTRSLGVEQRIMRQEDSGDIVLCNELSLSLVCITLEGKAVRLPGELLDCLRKVEPITV